MGNGPVTAGSPVETTQWGRNDPRGSIAFGFSLGTTGLFGQLGTTVNLGTNWARPVAARRAGRQQWSGSMQAPLFRSTEFLDERWVHDQYSG